MYLLPNFITILMNPMFQNYTYENGVQFAINSAILETVFFILHEDILLLIVYRQVFYYDCDGETGNLFYLEYIPKVLLDPLKGQESR